MAKPKPAKRVCKPVPKQRIVAAVLRPKRMPTVAVLRPKRLPTVAVLRPKRLPTVAVLLRLAYDGARLRSKSRGKHTEFSRSGGKYRSWTRARATIVRSWIRWRRFSWPWSRSGAAV